jgi:hypothetical protein
MYPHLAECVPVMGSLFSPFFSLFPPKKEEKITVYCTDGLQPEKNKYIL